jgi:dolichyl-phosphate beta-glucosyltransferase
VTGVAATWPNATYLTAHRLPAVRDISGYVWDLWWTAHQVTHLGNPFFTHYMAAPVGIQLGFTTTMPLAGLIMTPVTLAFGPSVSYSLLTILLPGLACYVMYRAARLWLAAPGAVAAGALFGLSSMLAWQDWFHLNIALGTLFLPMTLEAAVRLRRSPGLRQGVILGLVLGASVLVNQESAVLAVLLAAAALLPWLARHPGGLRVLAAGAVAAVVVASPQLIAMAQQAVSGGASISAAKLASNYGTYGAGLPGLFAPSPQLGHLGLHAVASAYQYRISAEAVATFGVVLSVLAVCGLAASWRRRSTRLLALLWLGGAVLALGSTLVIGTRAYVPLAVTWNGARVSLLMPYTWLVHVPGLSALREADRLAMLGLVGAAVLAGGAVDWLILRRHARPRVATGALVVVAALAIMEAGWTGTPEVRGLMPTADALRALDRPIAADHSGSIVLDVPFGLRGGLPLYGAAIAKPTFVLATADGHPRAVSYTSWVPRANTRWFKRHPFYVELVAVQNGSQVSAAELAAARRDVRGMNIGWMLDWGVSQPVVQYLTATGFVFDYRADQVSVYRPGWR